MSHADSTEQQPEVRCQVITFLSGDHLVCGLCSTAPPYEASTTADMLAHLRTHQERGDTVPESAFVVLEKGQEEIARRIAEKRAETSD